MTLYGIQARDWARDWVLTSLPKGLPTQGEPPVESNWHYKPKPGAV